MTINLSHLTYISPIWPSNFCTILMKVCAGCWSISSYDSIIQIQISWSHSDEMPWILLIGHLNTLCKKGFVTPTKSAGYHDLLPSFCLNNVIWNMYTIHHSHDRTNIHSGSDLMVIKNGYICLQYNAKYSPYRAWRLKVNLSLLCISPWLSPYPGWN